jgi:hypothetical protein
MDYLLLAFNIAILLFWVRIWSSSAREFHFNPFLSGTVRLTDAAFDFLRPALRAPDGLLALLLLAALLAFKTLCAGRLGHAWSFTIGGSYQFSAPALGGSWAPHFLYSALDAAALLLRLWTVYFLVRLISSGMRPSRASEAFAYFCRPFSTLPMAAQPLALAALHALLAVALARLGSLSVLPQPGQAGGALAASPFVTGPLVVQLLKTGWLAALSGSDGIVLLLRALLVAILCNFGAALLQAKSLLIVSHEAVELLLGRFARSRGAVGGLGIDFTPLIFFFVANLLYGLLRSSLCSLIQAPLA